jgi:hypothetical protein
MIGQLCQLAVINSKAFQLKAELKLKFNIMEAAAMPWN